MENNELSESDIAKLDIIIRFLQVTKDGLTKPYDPTPFLRKLDTLSKDGVDISGMAQCCPTSAEVKDAKDFKPYITASLEEYARIMGIEVTKIRNQGSRKYGERKEY